MANVLFSELPSDAVGRGQRPRNFERRRDDVEKVYTSNEIRDQAEMVY